MRFLCEVCPKKRTYLISPHDIAIALSKKYVLSTSELDEIMQELSFENYIDFVATEGKNGYYYCVTLKKRGQSFEYDLREKKFSSDIINSLDTDVQVMNATIGLLSMLIAGNQFISTTL